MTNDTDDTLDDGITDEEVVRAIKALKSGKPLGLTP